MATNPSTLRSGLVPRRPLRRRPVIDGLVIRWVIGVGGVVALLALAALPGPAPEVRGAGGASAVAIEQPAPQVMDGRGKWTGYSSTSPDWNRGPAATPGGWSAPAQLALCARS
jgi:hypothetical protein